jgi:uncharacterized protein
VDATVMADAVAASPLSVRYGQPVDRDSAYERLAARLAPPPMPSAPAPAPSPEPELPSPWPEIPEREPEPRRRGRAQAPPEGDVVGKVLGSAAFRSFTRSAASALGRELTRGLFGNRRRRR